MISDSELKVVVLGLGYIGLPTAAVIARTGASVLGIDVTASVVETINSGKVHIEEVDLDGLVSGVVARGSLRASMQVEPADVFVIAVPTPFADDHAPNIGYVLQAATTIATVLKAGDTVILESTSPVGTTEQVRDLLATLRPDLRVPGTDPARIRRAGGHRDRLLSRTRVARPHPGRTDRQRPGHRRDHAAVRTQGADLLSAVRPRRLRHHHRPRRRNNSAKNGCPSSWRISRMRWMPIPATG